VITTWRSEHNKLGIVAAGHGIHPIFLLRVTRLDTKVTLTAYPMAMQLVYVAVCYSSNFLV